MSKLPPLAWVVFALPILFGVGYLNGILKGYVNDWVRFAVVAALILVCFGGFRALQKIYYSRAPRGSPNKKKPR